MQQQPNFIDYSNALTIAWLPEKRETLEVQQKMLDLSVGRRTKASLEFSFAIFPVIIDGQALASVVYITTRPLVVVHPDGGSTEVRYNQEGGLMLSTNIEGEDSKQQVMTCAQITERSGCFVTFALRDARMNATFGVSGPSCGLACFIAMSAQVASAWCSGEVVIRGSNRELAQVKPIADVLAKAAKTIEKGRALITGFNADSAAALASSFGPEGVKIVPPLAISSMFFWDGDSMRKPQIFLVSTLAQTTLANMAAANIYKRQAVFREKAQVRVTRADPTDFILSDTNDPAALELINDARNKRGLETLDEIDLLDWETYPGINELDEEQRSRIEEGVEVAIYSAKAMSNRRNKLVNYYLQALSKVKVLRTQKAKKMVLAPGSGDSVVTVSYKDKKEDIDLSDLDWGTDSVPSELATAVARAVGSNAKKVAINVSLGNWGKVKGWFKIYYAQKKSGNVTTGKNVGARRAGITPKNVGLEALLGGL
jgi:hypothetical protein